MGEASEHGEATTSVLALLEVACPLGVLLMATIDGNNNWLRNSLPHISRMPNLLPGRPLDYLADGRHKLKIVENVCIFVEHDRSITEEVR